MLKGLSVSLNVWVGPFALFGICSVGQSVVPIHLRAAKVFASLCVNDGINHGMCAREYALCAHATILDRELWRLHVTLLV